jgi:hypothetical protein
LSHVVIFFSTNTETMVAGKALRDAGVWNKIVPKPAAAKTEANMCLEIELTAEMKAMTVLSSVNVPIAGTVPIPMSRPA